VLQGPPNRPAWQANLLLVLFGHLHQVIIPVGFSSDIVGAICPVSIVGLQFKQ
jgi:hypothetical protein